MKTFRFKDQNGRRLNAKDRNPSQWSIVRTESAPGKGVRVYYQASRKISGAMYVLELTGEELDQMMFGDELHNANKEADNNG